MTNKHVIMVVRDGHRYVFVFTGEDDLMELSRAVGRQAADPDLSFTWRDATTVVTRAMDEISKDAR